jgi:hypothetical protein
MRNCRMYLFFLIMLPSFNNPQSNQDETPWYTTLPACPCKDPDFNGVKIGDGWAKDKGDFQRYHQGAASSYRSYPSVKTSEGRSAQQCCYDEKGNLITMGRGAGTPDKVSVCKGEDKDGNMKLRLTGAVGHYYKDVKPWKKLMKTDSTGWQKYNAEWMPDNSNKCTVNTTMLIR